MQSSAPDDGQKHRPKHVELTWNNKLIYTVNLVGYFHISMVYEYKLVGERIIFPKPLE